MQYYQLDPNVLRTWLSAKVYYAVEDDNTAHTAVVVSVNQPWGDIIEYEEPLDKSDCWLITKTKYDAMFEHVIDLKSGIINP